MKIGIQILAFVTAIGVFSTPAIAVPSYYSVDSQNGLLVIVNPTTLAVTEIGALGVPTSGAGRFLGTEGLTAIGENELLATMVFDDGGLTPYGAHKFYKIDMTTGQATYLAEVIDGDGNPQVNLAQGLARNPLTGEVWVSYSSGVFSTTDLLGTVNLVTGIISPQTAPIGLVVGQAGLGRITFDAAGNLYAEAVFPATPTVTRNFYHVDITTATATLNGQFTAVNGRGNWLGPAMDGVIVALSQPEFLTYSLARQVVLEDAATGAIIEVIGDLPAKYTLRDLAVANVPDSLSSEMALSFLILLALAARRSGAGNKSRLMT